MIDNNDILKRILLSGPLQEITFYQVNDTFFEFPNDEVWIIDGGVELKFPYGIVSAAWNPEFETYIIKNEFVKNICNLNNLYMLENNAILKLKRFIGQKVINVGFETREFEFIVDYTMKTEKEKRLVELLLTFQNTMQIQIALIDYLLEVNKAPKDFTFDISTELLISTKNIIEIK